MLGVAAERIVFGLFKVLIVSEVLDTCLKQVIAAVAEPGSYEVRTAEAGLLISIYPVYLYFNFSGSQTSSSVARRCSASGCRRTSTGRLPPSIFWNSGAAGT